MEWRRVIDESGGGDDDGVLFLFRFRFRSDLPTGHRQRDVLLRGQAFVRDGHRRVRLRPGHLHLRAAHPAARQQSRMEGSASLFSLSFFSHYLAVLVISCLSFSLRCFVSLFFSFLFLFCFFSLSLYSFFLVSLSLYIRYFLSPFLYIRYFLSFSIFVISCLSFSLFVISCLFSLFSLFSLFLSFLSSLSALFSPLFSFSFLSCFFLRFRRLISRTPFT